MVHGAEERAVKHVPKECRDTQCAAHGVAALHTRATFGRRSAIARIGSRMSEQCTDTYGYNMRDELVFSRRDPVRYLVNHDVVVIRNGTNIGGRRK